MGPKRKSAAATEASAQKKPKGKAAGKAKAKAKGEAEGKGAGTATDLKGSSSKAIEAASAASGSLFSELKDKSWVEKLSSELQKDYMKGIENMLTKEYGEKQIFPPKDLIFNALNLTPFDKVKVVILGQDPYHDDGQAMGLSFSVPKGIKPPPSLKNIYKELQTDIPGFKSPDHGNLEKWAKQGVLLLNATLTVEAHKPNSHAKCGWQTFTDHVIKVLSAEGNKIVFVLWGGFAHKKDKLIDSAKHHVLKTAHPSPLSASKFFGCKCFSQTNAALKKFGQASIDWNL